MVFEDIIDAMVFELYFSTEFSSADIAIMKYVKDEIKPIDGLEEEDKQLLVHNMYMQLSEKKNPLRNQIILMKIELKELLNPIISV